LFDAADAIDELGLPDVSLLDLAGQAPQNRTVLSQFHTYGPDEFYMLRDLRHSTTTVLARRLSSSTLVCSSDMMTSRFCGLTTIRAPPMGILPPREGLAYRVTCADTASHFPFLRAQTSV
jgi:hypothetical protein